jgi:hypothetical protein
MTADEACAQLTFLTGRIVDICMEMGLDDTDLILDNVEGAIEVLKVKLKHSHEEP